MDLRLPSLEVLASASGSGLLPGSSSSSASWARAAQPQPHHEHLSVPTKGNTCPSQGDDFVGRTKSMPGSSPAAFFSRVTAAISSSNSCSATLARIRSAALTCAPALMSIPYTQPEVIRAI